MANVATLISAPDPDTPEFQQWVKQTLATKNGVRAFLNGISHILHNCSFGEGYESLRQCVGELGSGVGVRRSVFRDALWELKTQPSAYPDEVNGVRFALTSAVRKVGFRKDRERIVHGRRGGRKKAANKSEHYREWRALAKDFIRAEPRLSRGETSEKVLDWITSGKMGPLTYELQFLTEPERRDERRDSEPGEKEARRVRDVRMIYIHLQPLFKARKSPRGRQPGL